MTLAIAEQPAAAGSDVHAISPTSIPADAVALSLPDDMAQPEWLAMGRSLAVQKRTIDWLIGDWLVHGRKHFPEQIEMAIETVTTEKRDAKRIEAVAAAFPAHLRDKSLSFDHHAQLAAIPMQQALPLLKQAKAEKLDIRAMRLKAMLAKIELGITLPRDDVDDDPDYRALKAIAAYWNRAHPHVREQFAELAADAGTGVIEV